MSGFLINPYRFGVAYDADAQTYISAVEAADGQALETGVKDAINAFVVGCKADGIWSAIKASCILAGARTLSGALVPLVGVAPTNVGPFVSGDYNRKTGLVGNGTSKYLDSNRTGSADPQNSHHLATWITTASTNNGASIGVESATLRNTLYVDGFALRQAGIDSPFTGNPTGLRAASRSASNLTSWRAGTQSGTYATVSASSTYGNIAVFARNDAGSFSLRSNARLAFYSIGESLNLALLDSRVSTLISALAAAIP